MTPIFQSTFYPQGDCMTAALASILNMRLKDVPRFIDHTESFYEDIDAWLESHGLEYLGVSPFAEGPRYTVDGYYLVMGRSPRGCSHVVVYNDGALVHDPHPSGAGIDPKDIFVIRRKGA